MREVTRPDSIAAGCKAEPGTYVPVVNRGHCEAKAECVEVCPYGVFEVRRIEDGDYAALGWLSKLKVRAHGMRSAYTPNVELCRACGQCVAACPEKAIRLVRNSQSEPHAPR